MILPNFREEKKLWKNGYKHVVGLDEVGRGPLAGPVVAAVVLTKPKIKYQIIGVRDSKKISEKNRENLYKILTSHKDIKWGIGIVREGVIDKINILEATKLAMLKAIDNLGVVPNFLLLDGNFKIKSNIPQKSVIKGDEKIFSCAAASIIAKVTRDRIMKKMHRKYIIYGFDSHKGYGTARHIENLKKFGPCKIHRKTFYPVSGLV